VPPTRQGQNEGCGDTIATVPILERETILDGLDSLLGRAAWEGGRVVLVRGEAGIGKSTLVKAFIADRGDHVLWGTCDPVALPQPLGPIVDMAEQHPAELADALRSGDRHRVSSALLSLLRAEGGPWIAVIEDVQWADEATLELLKVVGRRIDQVPALLLVTLRDEEVGPTHPLSETLGEVPSASIVSVPLPALSLSAVQELAAGTGVDPVALHAAAAGNPFFVTEVLASGGNDLPVTVRDAVWARVSRLSEEPLKAIQAAAVLGQRCDLDVVCRIAVVPPAAVADCVAQGLLRRDGGSLDFRHELAQRAVLDALSAADRISLHCRALAVLSERPATTDPSELANHAVGAADADAILDLAPQAAKSAAELGAHRAALMYYDAAVPFAGRLAPDARAALLVAHAFECYVAEDLDRALSSQREAIACWRGSGDAEAEAEAMVGLALFEYWSGNPSAALATAEEALVHHDSMAPSPGLARAYARLAQLRLVTGNLSDAITWGTRAVELAQRCAEEATVVHALNTIGAAEIALGIEGGQEKLEESLQRAYAAELEEDIARAYNNLLANATENRRYDLLDRFSELAMQFATERDLDLTRRCLVGDLAEAALERGRWDEACQQARLPIDNGWRSGRLQSLWVLGLVAARRGDADASTWLDEALAKSDSAMGASLLGPMRAARAEAAWLAGDMARAATEVDAGLDLLSDHESGWKVGGLAFWARKLDMPYEVPPGVAEPYALLFAGYPRKSAAAWADIGCPYEEALALAESDDEGDIRRALEILLDLGAVSTATIVSSQLKAMGAHRIARGPRASTRANPAGLSAREMEVLLLVSEGLRNAEIAQRLVVSPKTVDHHVSSMLAKLGARDRHDAAKKAAELGITR
jgi:DNA-binding CsgD family transcriptional regulator